MSKPITAKRFTELCKEWGIKYVPIKADWSTHNRNHKGPWSDLNGVMMHHTGPFGTVAGMERILWDGYAGLPGPLCQSGIDPAGILRLAGWGRANHAGMGDSAVLRRVKQGDLPKSGNLRPTKADVDGNAHFYGFEIMASGNEPMTEAQRITSVRVAALLCREHNWGADVIGHGEWQPGKWDPGAHKKLINMGEFRNWVAQAIKEGPPSKLPTRPKPIEDVTQQKTIKVEKGDSLISLAKEHLGSSSRWPDFVSANPKLLRPLQPGEKLILPKK